MDTPSEWTEWIKWLWFIGALLLGIVEITTGTLFCLCLALGAVAAGLVGSVLPGAIALQWLAFLSVSLGSMLFLPRWGRQSGGPGAKTNVDALIGERALVTEAIDPVTGKGMIKVGGETWRAQADEPIPAGQYVYVEEIRGTKVVVYPALEMDQPQRLAGEQSNLTEDVERLLRE